MRLSNETTFAPARTFRLAFPALLFAFSMTAGAAQPDAPAQRPAAPASVEECIAEKRCAPGDDADTCMADFGKPDACKQKHAKDGFVFACKTRNMSRWNEVWCRPGKAGAAAPAARPQ